MMFKKLILLASLMLAVPAWGQTLTPQPDVGTYIDTPATYETDGSTPNRVGDGSNDKGGTAPAFTTFPEVSDPTDRSLAQWSTDGWVVNDSSVCLTNTTTCPEKKFRIRINSAKILYDDPIRFYGQPGVSHCHEFFGNIRVNAFSTPLSLRYAPASTAAGGIAWSTGYWEPCWVKTISAKKYAMPAVGNAVYYTRNGTSPMKDDLQPLHQKLRFIFGTNSDDPMDCKFKNELDVANGGAGTTCTVRAGRYSYLGNGFLGYQCSNYAGNVIRALKTGLTAAPGFTLADGSDPWEGRCVDGDTIYAEAHAPLCWDGKNISSPGGYWHLRQEVQDNYVGGTTCPKGWYKIPDLQIKSAHQTRGFADYSTWKLDSDAMFAAKCTALGQTCPTTIPGWSFHADWMNGIALNIRNQVLSFCLGIGSNVPHQCDVATGGATISASTALTSGNAPDGSRMPQVQSPTIDSNNAANLKLVETTRTSTHDMKGM
ncbi:DUF1996 domain-containing protein [Sphingomonas panacisoli]|uniref:DUF1996 domain-containing protein n=1 Tax=Sphingomonas panacisoli TaxID=1813879 RepID=A0A5B8LHV7_9SPHN|nr:DUF1996 domain-containing protein [Sphingomonas panacisoli]QDZ07456.1 DUF1996 domain-containing protein [Sphingomonas panacisoli]